VTDIQGITALFKTFHSFTHVAHAAILNLEKKEKLVLYLTKPVQNFPYKEIQLNSGGIRCGLKGWMSHDALQHVCKGHTAHHA
jgi:hypothetical protein